MKIAYYILNRSMNLLLDIFFTSKSLRGNQKSSFRNQGSSDIVNSSYLDILYIYKYMVKNNIKPKDTDIIVDVGCGKGRVLALLTRLFRNNRIVGFEIQKNIAEKTKNLLKKYRNIDIIVGDINEIFPSYADVFYLFNPFDENCFKKFINNIETKGKKNILLINYAPQHLSAFSDKWDIQLIVPPWWFQISKNYPFAAIIKRKQI